MMKHIPREPLYHGAYDTHGSYENSPGSNCAFGGDGLGHLYVTTLSGHLYRVRNTGLRGLALPPTMP